MHTHIINVVSMNSLHINKPTLAEHVIGCGKPTTESVVQRLDE